MITYLDILSNYFPGVGATYNGKDDKYENIIWDNEIISKLELDFKKIEEAKNIKISELSEYARTLVCEGFISDTLGYPRWYDGNLEDQLNLAGATVAAGELGEFYYPSRDITTRVKEYIPHTFEQMSKLTADGSLFKLGILSKFNRIKIHILSLNDINLIEEVEWDIEI